MGSYCFLRLPGWLLLLAKVLRSGTKKRVITFCFFESKCVKCCIFVLGHIALCSTGPEFHSFGIKVTCLLGRYSKKAFFRPEELLVNAFNSTSEGMKTAASYALGRLALGNLEKYLPFLLEQINSQPKRQYLLLHALKEVPSFNFQHFSIFKS